MKRAVTLCAVMITAALFVSCGDDSNPVSKIEDIVFPEKDISYNRHIQPLFNIACATSGCHDVKTKASNLDLSDYTGIKQRFYDVVIPRDTVLSRLLWSIEGRPGAAPMPPSRSLTLNQLRGFNRWIMEGATDTIR
ncbi:MAG: hypothetical protein F9K22_07355 [Bacteroidetes bacterium]|nr:MAG: hypothetical protein F9K22_07355 [Bacteroidota bacterium]